jgi:hypothetical protein
MSTRILIAALVSCIATALAQAQSDPDKQRSLELSLSEEAGQLRYDTPSNLGGADSRMFYTLFLSEDRDVVGSAALLLNSDLQWGALTVRFGPQAYAALLDEENEDVFALALGVEARFEVVKSRGIAVVGSAFYSPDILTFGSADNLTDFMARGEIRINENLIGLAGYRWFELDLLNREERELQNEIFVGARWILR